MNNYKELLAHYDVMKPERSQPLLDHLLSVANYSRVIGDLVKMKSSCQLIGLLHDFGKVSNKFQSYIRGNYSGRVVHSSAGGIIIEYIADKVYRDYSMDIVLEKNKIKKSNWDLYREILQYPILAHHGLYDIIDKDFNYRTGLRLDLNMGNKDNFIDENLMFLNLLNEKYIKVGGKSVYDLYYEGFKEFINVHENIKTLLSDTESNSDRQNNIRRNKSLNFYYGALIRLLLSILKDADIYDSSNYYKGDKDKLYSQGEINKIWSDVGDKIENLYQGFNENPNKSELDIIRTNLANEIYEFSLIHDKGTYKLDMPVGERVIIVMGAVCVIKSRVSGTLNKYNSCIA